MNRNHVTTVIFALFILGLAAHVAAQDIPGSSDHPAVARFQGSVIRAQARQSFDAYTVPLGPADASEKKFKKQEEVEGKVLKTLYKAPTGSSPLEVYRSYENALRQAGFEVLFSCAAKQCSQEGSLQNTLGYSGKYLSQLGGHSLDDGASYLLTARQAKSNTYVVVCASHLWGDPATVFYTVDVIELKPMQTGLVTVNAQALADDITKSGHATVYGIYFDTGKADIKPESTPVLDEISKLLNTNTGLKLHVIGHTDNVGSLASNMALSKQRAEAVVKVLTTKYRIVPARLQAGGVGPLSPVATNRTEEGRAKNRRVELVEQ
jgi:outer membrane protein OmpA-like peptidoglycan-associated protein